ncbi:MAG: hypothetical protein AAF546_15375 [Verrucomicrobiota bacterium]
MPIDPSIVLFFELYASSFTKCDVSAISRLWHLPAFITADQRSAVFDDEQRFASNTQALCDFYQRQGVVRATKEVLATDEHYPGVVTVRTRDDLFGEDDSLVVTWEHTYMIRRIDGEWRVLIAVADGEVAAWNARGTPLGS